MKSVILCVSACIGFTVMGHSQFRKIPPEVTKALKHKYPAAERISWSNRQSLFQAAFFLYGIPFTADFLDNGSWQQSAQDIRADSLPAEVLEGFQDSRYAGWQIKKAAMLVRADAQPGYRLYIAKSGIHQKYLYFTADGQLEKEALTILP